MTLTEKQQKYQHHHQVKLVNNNYKFKIPAPAQNEEFELPNGSYSLSDIQD